MPKLCAICERQDVVPSWWNWLNATLRHKDFSAQTRRQSRSLTTCSTLILVLSSQVWPGLVALRTALLCATWDRYSVKPLPTVSRICEKIGLQKMPSFALVLKEGQPVLIRLLKKMNRIISWRQQV